MGMAQLFDPERWIQSRRRRIGVAVSEDRLVGISVSVRAGKSFAHLLSDPAGHEGWAVLLEPLRFFARRAVIPPEFSGREAEYIRYNRTDIVPVPESQTLALRFASRIEAGETLFHGTRADRMEEFLARRRSDASFPKIEGVVPPSVALGAAIRAVRPNLPPRTLAVLVGSRTTRYVAFRDGVLVNVFDDVHRSDAAETRIRFRKTLQRVTWHMEKEGLGGMADQVFILGDPTTRDFVADARQIVPVALIDYLNIPREMGLILPEGLAADHAILAVGAAVASADASYAELNFTGVPKAVAARRFDAYDLVMYGSMAAMLVLSFVTLNAYVGARVQSLRADLESDTRRIRDLREEVDAKRGILPVAERLVKFSEQRPPSARIDQQIMESLPEFFMMISESVPAGVWLDRITGGIEPSDGPAQGYKGIRARAGAGGQVMISGQTRLPEKAIAWVSRLSSRLAGAATMDEMKLDADGVTYRFKILISPLGEKSHA